MKSYVTTLTAFIGFALCAVMFSCQHTDVQPTAPVPTTGRANLFPIFDFQADLARPSNNCLSGWGFCNGHLVIFWFPVFRTANGDPMTPFSGYVEPVDGAAENVRNLVFQFANKEDIEKLGTNHGERIVEIATEQPIDSDAAEKMGYSSMAMQPGNYAFDPSIGEIGGFKVRVIVKQ